MTDSKIVNVPKEFRFQDPFFYPSDNEIDFEYWLSMNIKDGDITSWERCYLPITWTAYYKYHNYGENISANERLQKFIDTLDRSKKYFTIIQFDLGCLNDLSGLDIKVFSMAGKPMDYPLPLICQPHNSTGLSKNRGLVACFIGANTHPIREEIYKLGVLDKYYCTNIKHLLSFYCHVISDSIFSICPRGVSPTSFRIQESLELGSIPVYVSDGFIEPHNIPFENYGIKVKLEDVRRIPEILAAIDEDEIFELQAEGKQVYHDLYTFEANKILILENI